MNIEQWKTTSSSLSCRNWCEAVKIRRFDQFIYKFAPAGALYTIVEFIFMFMNWWEIYTFLKDEWHDFVLRCTLGKPSFKKKLDFWEKLVFFKWWLPLLCRVDSFVGKICKTKLQEQGQSEENSTTKDKKDLQLARWICRIHSGNSPHGNIYSRLDGGDQMSQINLKTQDSHQSRSPSSTWQLSLEPL